MAELDGSVADPDPGGSGFKSPDWIRIRIRNPDSLFNKIPNFLVDDKILLLPLKNVFFYRDPQPEPDPDCKIIPGSRIRNTTA